MVNLGQMINLLKQSGAQMIMITPEEEIPLSLGARRGNFIMININDERLNEYLEVQVLRIEPFHDKINLFI